MSGNGSIADAFRGVTDAVGIKAAYDTLDRTPLRTVDDARGVINALDVVSRLTSSDRHKPLGYICTIMQNVESEEAFDTLVEEALPRIENIFRSTIQELDDEAGDLLMALKILVMYRWKNAVPIVTESVHAGYRSGSWFWTIVLGAFPKDNPIRLELCKALTSPLPDDFVGVAFLDFCNETALNETLGPQMKQHPFDTPEGHARLKQYLTNPDPESYSYAHSATATLPFVSADLRRSLIGVALDHPNQGVQLEAAWASAKSGSESGFQILQRCANDPRVSTTACAYLEELGRDFMIPDVAREPDFVATATLCGWLSHPNEAGEPPDSIEIIDSREMVWPPTGDRRQLWLFRFVFERNEYRKEMHVGFGLVGGQTPWSFFDEIKPDWPVEDMYAIHCSWEAAQSKDESIHPLENYSVKHGRRLLQSANRSSKGLSQLFKRFLGQ